MDYECGVTVVVIEQCAHAEVAYAYLRCGVEVNAAVYSGEAPHVLVLKVTAVRILENFQRYCVHTVLKVGRKAELGRLHAAFGVAYLPAVDVNVERTGHGTEVDVDFLAVPSGGHRERAAVAAGGVALDECRVFALRLLHHERRVYLERVARTAVYGRAVAVDLPVAGHGEGGPAGVVEVFLVKVGRLFVGRFRPVELPHAVERHLHVARFFGIWYERSTCQFAVYRQYILVFPVVLLCGGRQRACSHCGCQ